MEVTAIEAGLSARPPGGVRAARGRTQSRAALLNSVARTDVLDAAARVLLRRGYQGLLFGAVARELGVPTLAVVRIVSDKPDLVRLCYRRSAQALEDALMAAETTTGLAVQKLDVFLDWMFAARAERGCLLPLALAEGPTRVDVLWCRDKERAIRTRLERMIRSGQRDGSINARDAGAACHLILALLQSPEVPVVAGTSSAGLDELKQLIFGGLAAR